MGSSQDNKDSINDIGAHNEDSCFWNPQVLTHMTDLDL